MIKIPGTRCLFSEESNEKQIYYQIMNNNYYFPSLIKLKIAFLAVFLCNTFLNYGQVNPTLGVGLETLTLNKGTIDVEVLTQIIMEKQKELKKEALKRFMFKLFPDTNYATRFYVQNCLHTLLNEKNPQVIEKEVLELTTNYALALGIAKVYQDLEKLNPTDPSALRLMDSIGKTIKKETGNQGKITYSLMVDIVSFSLSTSSKMKERGFYKYKVNYKEGEEYKELAKDTILIKKLEELEGKIIKQIEAYLENFEIIKEFYSRNKGKNSNAIISSLLTDYTSDIFNVIDRKKFKEMTTALMPHASPTFKEAVLDFGRHSRDYDRSETYYKRMVLLANESQSFQNYPSQKTDMETKISNLSNRGEASFDLVKIESEKNLITDTLKLKELNAELNEYKIKTAAFDAYQKRVKENDSTFLYFKKINPNNVNRSNDEVIKLFKEDKLNESYHNQVQDGIKLMIKNDLEIIVKAENFFKLFLKDQIENILDGNLDLKLDASNEFQLKIINEYAETLSKFYTKLDVLSKQDNVSLTDIRYIEEEIIPTLFKYSTITKDSISREKLKESVDDFKLLAGLLKINAVVKTAVKIGNYDEKFDDILTFVSNLDKLDKAETYQSIINLIRDNNENIVSCLEKHPAFKNTYLVFVNAIKKYTIINTSEEYVNIDVISFLNDLQQYYGRNEKSFFSLYLTLGLSENFFFNDVLLEGAKEPISSIGFASEKLGLKFRFWKIGALKGYDNLIKDDLYLNKRNPFVNEVYGIIYGSGLLYSLANTATKENFDYPHIGIGAGVRFYNALDLNLSIGIPFIDGQPFSTHNGFFSIGLDIPLGEYLEKLGKK